jgi:polyisoprenoid-binding protein YceI
MEEHPEIKFDLSNGKVVSVDGDEFTVNATGDLEIAGVKKAIEFSAVGSQPNSTQLVFSGSHEVNMTEYEVEPPSAMFGQIVTGELVVINFNLVLDNE